MSPEAGSLGIRRIRSARHSHAAADGARERDGEAREYAVRDGAAAYPSQPIAG